ncbi:HTH-type transcriptional regulator DmlR [Methylobacterium hispanicum]|jgi:DNA-binding transcriptional LysR family regulator|uniref:HTH-type transcriptional regulator DmlR n=1 Tax=Methylobacterium hispanicum TaxID=270350 RepID=A0AAV4ZUK4_9HYPH|nr:HTH-type transcriptional regulator DmlR [Methylobacterium hispanicum]
MVARAETFGGDILDVRAFCAVVDLGTVTAAAASLRETKGSVSRRLSRLERALDARLLARHPRAVTPTPEGLAFYARAKEGLALFDEAAESARDSHAVPAGHLRVTTSVDFGIEVMPEIVASFRALFPQITVELLNTDGVLDLAANRVDLALRLGGEDGDTGYRASMMATLAIGLYASPAYLERRPAPAGLPDLADYDLILGREKLGPFAKLLSADGRIEPVLLRPAILASDFAAVLRLTLVGAGIGQLPTLVAARSVQSGDLVRVLPGWSSGGGTLRAISLAGRELPARVRLFREHVRGALASRLAVEMAPR